MKDDQHKREAQAASPAKKDPRRDRLKQALRENLKRRKSQARGRGDVTAAPSTNEEGSLHDRSGKKPGE
jgi:hypothetical protein